MTRISTLHILTITKTLAIPMAEFLKDGTEAPLNAEQQRVQMCTLYRMGGMNSCSRTTTCTGSAMSQSAEPYPLISF